MSIAPVENKMETKSSKHAEEKEIHEETDDVTNIVTNVIHEYDVIDDPPNDCQSTSTATNQIDEKDDDLINAPRNNQVGLKRENEYIPIFEYILSFKDSSSYLEIGKSMQKIKL